MTTRIKHPDGGFLTGELSPNGLFLRITDTRKISGVRRNVRAVVQERGINTWTVHVEKGDGYNHFGPFNVATPWAAYELI